MTVFFKNGPEITFNTFLNESFYFEIGKSILSGIPGDLLTTLKTSERFGCPDCSDGCGIYFEITKNGQKQKFYIDNQTSQLSGDIKKFAELLKVKISDIEKRKAPR